MKPTYFTNIILLSGIILMSIACTSPKGDSGKGDITSSEWSLVSIKAKGNNNILTPPVNHTPVLSVSSDGTMSGTTGCNKFSGNVAVTGHTLQSGDIVTTRLVCSDAMEIEQAMIHTLHSANNYTVENGNLLLKKDNEVLATFKSIDKR